MWKEAALDTRELQRGMYEHCGPSKAQRLTLAALAAVWLALAWWLLFGGGIAAVGAWSGQGWRPGDALRRACLAGGFTVYFVRILFTTFVFLKRGMSWGEVFTIAPWLLFLSLLVGIAGGRQAAPLAAAGMAGIALFLAGSWMNSYAEYARYVWRRRPENQRRLYTGSLFRWSRHPNYLGDLVSFSGLSLISGAWVTATIPALMLAGFVFANVPALDAHLREKYGVEFDEYAARTKRLIPFVY
ncbi:MAG TPA: DUF1295 domain-containing protein [Bryobacteraceae bacterium]|nr:DUF1295 domain-containing protein [Bryobacteraceae bacterium]